MIGYVISSPRFFRHDINNTHDDKTGLDKFLDRFTKPMEKFVSRNISMFEVTETITDGQDKKSIEFLRSGCDKNEIYSCLYLSKIEWKFKESKKSIGYLDKVLSLKDCKNSEYDSDCIELQDVRENMSVYKFVN